MTVYDQNNVKAVLLATGWHWVEGGSFQTVNRRGEECYAFITEVVSSTYAATGMAFISAPRNRMQCYLNPSAVLGFAYSIDGTSTEGELA